MRGVDTTPQLVERDTRAGGHVAHRQNDRPLRADREQRVGDDALRRQGVEVARIERAERGRVGHEPAGVDLVDERLGARTRRSEEGIAIEPTLPAGASGSRRSTAARRPLGRIVRQSGRRIICDAPVDRISHSRSSHARRSPVASRTGLGSSLPDDRAASLHGLLPHQPLDDADRRDRDGAAGVEAAGRGDRGGGRRGDDAARRRGPARHGVHDERRVRVRRRRRTQHLPVPRAAAGGRALDHLVRRGGLRHRRPGPAAGGQLRGRRRLPRRRRARGRLGLPLQPGGASGPGRCHRSPARRRPPRRRPLLPLRHLLLSPRPRQRDRLPRGDRPRGPRPAARRHHRPVADRRGGGADAVRQLARRRRHRPHLDLPAPGRAGAGRAGLQGDDGRGRRVPQVGRQRALPDPAPRSAGPPPSRPDTSMEVPP